MFTYTLKIKTSRETYICLCTCRRSKKASIQFCLCTQDQERFAYAQTIKKATFIRLCTDRHDKGKHTILLMHGSSKDSLMHRRSKRGTYICLCMED